jgi:hypothetical protein
VGCDAVYYGRSLPIFRRNALPVSSGSEITSSKLVAYYLFVYSAPFSTLKMETVRSSETSVYLK